MILDRASMQLLNLLARLAPGGPVIVLLLEHSVGDVGLAIAPGRKLIAFLCGPVALAGGLVANLAGLRQVAGRAGMLGVVRWF
ncbi:MAG: hypothetical protein KY463_04805 [Actinobacteria bacterium]|nr:hypothetical protein [Actinomycetota bacterium]